MKRLPVHAHIDDLPASINFAISSRGGAPGVDHLRIQTDAGEELAGLKKRAEAAGMTRLDAGEASCCYARSDKHRLADPQGIAWERFHPLEDIPARSATSCCQEVS